MRKKVDDLKKSVQMHSEIKKMIKKVEIQEKDYTIMPTTSLYLTGHTSSGTRLYFALRGKPAHREQEILYHRNGLRKDLLEMNIHVMMRQVEAERLKAAEERSALDFTRERLSRFGTVFQDSDMGAGQEVAAHPGSPSLWVDKYSPKMYIDLVGDERVNREVLSWVKHWDFCVFKKKSHKGEVVYREAPYLTNIMKENPDPLRRPEFKLLLLAGPAGLGKTTLAHVVAKHAGYNVIEVNASDDRSGETVLAKITHSLESKCIRTGRPNLIIIDEIDGAAGGENSIIKFLVELSHSTVKKKEETDKEGDDPVAEGSTRKKKSKRILTTPIICICNDGFSPVLRPLRAVSRIIQFKTPPFRILANRLSEICKWEGLTVDLRTLMALCEMTDGDIRSSLNTLQFFRSRSHVLSYEMLAGANVGFKDMSRGLFRIWEAVFTLPNAKTFKHLGGRGVQSGSDPSRYHFKTLLALIDACGEEERLLQGCFENYTKLNGIDPMNQGASASKIEKAVDWLVSWDVSSSRAGGSQYQPFPIIAFHYLFAKVGRQPVDYPKSDHECFIATRASEGVVESTIKGLGPLTRLWWGQRSRMVMELLPPLIHIVTPNFYAVNIQTMRPHEKNMFQRIVHLMVSFGIRFVQDRLESGLFVFKFEPPIDKISKFEETETTSVQNLQIMFPVRQLIAKEIALENIRRYEEPRLKIAQAARQTTLKPITNTVPSSSSQPSSQFSKPAGMDGLPVPTKPLVIPKLIPKDFFGRRIVQAVVDGEF
ncbi:P-loop containing nucleoside triphosphate hydrolase protein [Chytridium lagenaria]|nr:P-loop containing nucleoside triphosphate hydrolase protein [Chytridium lagenaria]